MRCYTIRGRVDPVLALDQFSVARPLQPEDLDRRMTRQGIYPSFPAPNGMPWSEYVRTHRNRLQSISSSMEALESDHARYVTSTIAQHARSMATHARSLPTDSPIPYFQPIERGYMSEGSQEGITPYRVLSKHTINIGGTDYHSEITKTDRVSTFTGLDDYDTLFAARHGRGALDPEPKTSETKAAVSMSISIPMVGPELINPMEKTLPVYDDANLHQREQMQPQMTSPRSEIIGEGAAIFTDMTEMILDILDKKVITSPDSQQITKEIPNKDDQKIVDHSTQDMGPGILTTKRELS